MIHKLKSTLALSTALLFAAQVHAETVTDSFTVSATIAPACLIDSSTDMLFGDYDTQTGTQVDQASVIALTCSNGTQFAIKLNAGTNSADTAQRVMTSGTNTLNYNLFTDIARSTIWDEDNNVISGTGTGTQVSQQVFGRIAANQTSAPGDYTDTITVTVDFS